MINTNIKPEWSNDIKVGDKVVSLLSKQSNIITEIDWGAQMVTLKDVYNTFRRIKLGRFYEYYGRSLK